MSAYGVQIFNEGGENIVEKFRGNFAIDVFYVNRDTPSGSRNYPMKAGEWLEIGIASTNETTGGIDLPVVSGGTISWNNTGNQGMNGWVTVIKKGAL